MRLFFLAVLLFGVALVCPGAPSPTPPVPVVDNENPVAVQKAEVNHAIAKAQAEATPTPPTAAPREPEKEVRLEMFPEMPSRPPTLLVHYIADFLNKFPLVGILLLLILLDIVMGTMAALATKKLSSNVSWKGMTKKAASLLVLGMVAAVEPLTGLPLAKLVSLFYIWTEAISIVEAAAALGVPLPQQLLAALVKLKEADKIPVPTMAQTPPPAPQSVVINTRAVSVRPAAGQTQQINLPDGGTLPDNQAVADRTAAVRENTAAVQANTAARLDGGADEPPADPAPAPGA